MSVEKYETTFESSTPKGSIMIDITDYLPKEEIQRIARDVVRQQVAEVVHNSPMIERLVADEVRKEAVGELDEGTKERVRKSALAAIDDLSEFTLFRKEDKWAAEGLGRAALRSVTDSDEFKKAVHDRVLEVVNELGEGAVLDVIDRTAREIRNAVHEIIVGKE